MDQSYPDVLAVRVVLDCLYTHRLASQYDTFPPPEPQRIAKRLEIRHTPKRESWQNPVLSLPERWRRSSLARWHGLSFAVSLLTLQL